MARYKNPLAHLGNRSVRAAVRKQKPKKKLKEPYEINIYRKSPKRGVDANVHSLDLYNKRMAPVRAAKAEKILEEKDSSAFPKMKILKCRFSRNEQVITD
jgi:hypothetical protein